MEVDPALLAEQELPFYAGTWVVYLLTTNIEVAATLTHLLLWNRNDLRGAWSWANKDSLKRMWTKFDWRIWNADGKSNASPGGDLDPHYREMLKVLFCPYLVMITDALIFPQYPDAPNSWYGAILVSAFVTAIVIIYKTDSTLPW